MLGFYIIGTIVLIIGGIIAFRVYKKRKELSLAGLLCLAIGVMVLIIATSVVRYTAQEAKFRYEQAVIIQQEARVDNDNPAVSERVLDYNEWVIKAKIDKGTFGIFSPYFFVDLDRYKLLIGANRQ